MVLHRISPLRKHTGRITLPSIHHPNSVSSACGYKPVNPLSILSSYFPFSVSSVSRYSMSSPVAYMSTSKSSTPAGPVHVRIPPGDDKPRLVCDDCGYIAYKNPLLVNGTVVLAPGPMITNLGKFFSNFYPNSSARTITLPEEIPWVLLGKRDIEPRRGYWTLPAGYQECNESTIEGAVREAKEETLANIEVKKLIGVYSIPRISQVHMWYIGQLLHHAESNNDTPSSKTNNVVTATELTSLLLNRNGMNISCSPHQRNNGSSNSSSNSTKKVFGAGSETQEALMFPLLPPSWCSTYERKGETLPSSSSSSSSSSTNLLPGRITIVGNINTSGTTVTTYPLLPWNQLAFPSVEYILTTVANTYWGIPPPPSIEDSGATSTRTPSPEFTDTKNKPLHPRPMKNLQELFRTLQVDERVIRTIPNWERKGN